MMPRNFFRNLTLVLCLCFIALGFTIPAHTDALATHPAIQGMTKGFCASDVNGPTVYFSNIFDANTKAKTKIITLPLNFAFFNHLVEEYDYKTSSNYPTACSLFETLSQAEGRRTQLVSEARRANKQVVEINWNPSPLVEVPQGDDSVTIGPKGPPPTHTFCALGHESTMYFSAVFDTSGALPNPAWNNAFNEFLRKNYSAEGEATCTIMNTVREAERNLKARVGGVRANNHKAVETGWKFDPTNMASIKPRPKSPKPTPKDDDPEPVAQRPAPTPPPADIRQFAIKEVPAALALCQNDRMVSGAFDCYCIQRSVYNYRIEHANQPGQPEPLADLFARDKLDVSGCVAQFVTMWATSHAQSQSLTRPVAECVARRFETALRAKPYPSHVKELFNAAVAACKQ